MKTFPELKTSGAGSCNSWVIRNPRNIYTEARKMEWRIEDALLAIEAQRKGNAEAATRTSNKNAAAWSAGVAKGLEIAAGFLEQNSQTKPAPH